jgi:hypothetical protein
MAAGMRHLFHFERRHEPLANPQRFSTRLLRNSLWAVGVVAAWLAIGTAGYAGFEGLPLIDAYLNAAMILSGMGPVDVLKNDGAKLFAGLYAIFSGLLIFGIAGLALAPVFHRLLHRFHVEDRNR